MFQEFLVANSLQTNTLGAINTYSCRGLILE